MQKISYLSRDDLLVLHAKAIDRFGGHAGLRDSGAVDSCVAQPRTEVFGVERFSSAFEKAAAYCYFIVRLHPFVDGNKRTGLLAGVTFLLDHGVEPAFDSDEMYRAIIAVAEGNLEIEALAAVFESGQQL